MRLNADRRQCLGNAPGIDPVIVGDEIGTSVRDEIPENLLGQPAACGRTLARKFEENVVAGQHKTVGAGKNIRFVLTNPSQLRRGKITGRVQQAFEAPFASQIAQSPFTLSDSPAVAPDNRLAQRFALRIETNQPMHLVGNADRPYGTDRFAFHQLPDTLAGILPPHPGILFGPSPVRRIDRHFRLRQCHRTGTCARSHLQQCNLHRRTADINS